MLARNSMGNPVKTGRASRYDATFIFLYWKMKTLSADVATVSKEMGSRHCRGAGAHVNLDGNCALTAIIHIHKAASCDA